MPKLSKERLMTRIYTVVAPLIGAIEDTANTEMLPERKKLFLQGPINQIIEVAIEETLDAKEKANAKRKKEKDN